MKVSLRSFAICAASTVAVGGFSASAGAASVPGGSDTKADKAIARAAVLELEDFPTGWRSQRNNQSTEGDKKAAEVRECKRYVAARKAAKKRARAVSSEFVQGDDSAENTVVLYSDEAAATKALSVYDEDNTAPCLEKVAKALFDSELEDADAADSVEKVTVSVGKSRVEPVGDAVVAYELEIKVESKVGTSETFAALNQTVRVGRALVSYTFESQVESLTDLTPSLIDASLRRLRAAMGQGATPSPSQGIALGETAVGAKGAKVTVFAYSAPAQVRFSLSPSSVGGPPDAVWATVDAQVCAGETGEVTASPSEFKLAFPDNTRAESKYGAEPAFPSFTTVRQGDCVRGLITYAVSLSVRPASVLYESLGSEAPTLRWAVG